MEPGASGKPVGAGAGTEPSFKHQEVGGPAGQQQRPEQHRVAEQHEGQQLPQHLEEVDGEGIRHGSPGSLGLAAPCSSLAWKQRNKVSLHSRDTTLPWGEILWSGGLMSTWKVVNDWCGPVQSVLAEMRKESLGSDQSRQIRTGKETDGNTDTGSGHGRGGEPGGCYRVQLAPGISLLGLWLCVQEASGSERLLVVHYQQHVLIKVVNSSKEATINI